MFFFSSRRRHTRSLCDWSSDVCSSDLKATNAATASAGEGAPTRSLSRRPVRRAIVGESGPLGSEERRVGKECRSRWWRDHEKKKKEAKNRRRRAKSIVSERDDGAHHVP